MFVHSACIFRLPLRKSYTFPCFFATLSFQHPLRITFKSVPKRILHRATVTFQMNYVFDGIYDRYDLSDPWVLLLEEDHYLAPDALHVLEIIIRNRKT